MMGKKLPYTPTSRIRSSIRQLWLRSRERSSAIRREHNTCQRCGNKGSIAKGREVPIEVHHINGIEWEEVIKYIRDKVLVDPEGLEVLCKECHKKETRCTEDT
jgi:5-methylcytosine-specific restriction endonuclease McrA